MCDILSFEDDLKMMQVRSLSDACYIFLNFIFDSHAQ